MSKLLLLFILFIIASCNSDTGNEARQSTIDSLLKANDLLKLELNKVAAQKEKVADTAKADHSMQVGNENSSRHRIVSDALRSKPELIPLDAVLGGTMYFSKIKVISDDLVLADYEDGHIMGQTLYEYKISGNGEVAFKAIRSREY